MLRLHTVLCVMLLALMLASTANTTPRYMSDTREYNLAHGRVVFTQHCLRCHEQGRKGAPVLSEPIDWVERLEQPLDTMISHAIEGHGDMSARGDTELTDQQIASAVAYVVNRTRRLVAEPLDQTPAKASSDGEIPTPASVDDAAVQMFLLLMGKDRWK